MIISIAVCLASFAVLLWLLRRDRASLGLPVAYLSLLLLNHVPGAYAHVVGAHLAATNPFVATGIGLTAVGAFCFLIGVGMARATTPGPAVQDARDDRRFWLFCLLGGWLFIYGLAPLRHIPSLGAAIDKGGAIWILGVMLGLRYAFQQRDWKWVAIWGAALAVYPVIMLVLGGFLSYGTAAGIVACSILAISTRANWRVTVSLLVIVFLSMTLFVNYYASRKEIRKQVWADTTVEQRIDANMLIFRNFKLFDPSDRKHLHALDERLNQNFFIGIAAKRMAGGQVSALHGGSVRDALVALVPRAIWPDKPVYGGSPMIVSKMTGIRFDTASSFGVGNVMEFYINFGVFGVIGGFVGLGWLLGWLDKRAALAEASGDCGRTILFFLPAVALIQPLGSMVELASGAAAALVAALAWRFAWTQWLARGSSGRGRRQQLLAANGGRSRGPARS